MKLIHNICILLVESSRAQGCATLFFQESFEFYGLYRLQISKLLTASFMLPNLLTRQFRLLYAETTFLMNEAVPRR